MPAETAQSAWLGLAVGGGIYTTIIGALIKALYNHWQTKLSEHVKRIESLEGEVNLLARVKATGEDLTAMEARIERQIEKADERHKNDINGLGDRLYRAIEAIHTDIRSTREDLKSDVRGALEAFTKLADTMIGVKRT